MRFLRMLTNSLVAGALGAAYLTILLLHLNPQVPLASLANHSGLVVIPPHRTRWPHSRLRKIFDLSSIR